ncbi:uncharacterized protein Z520_08233 [Fonsecaea multimorphosa CBS 102226]|uniref:AB hydrolase-1 domain-containing protein n=1 Tax=Fonsecaea multimorphosa CBS 102226 TaxID=1442371 RepID=A0A0D2KH57_9EURO|nr:uncharacterized protein Z520_08233 [Fonsecaea multimorphosa CBS 102226]KIX95978.1 hypothetical protein Z520_08233 [Fonsecaea multimorphosa CBS 102226]OAL21748.1 hypothetical protein AYO22_07690 [Fonsecaea multimorphosa]
MPDHQISASVRINYTIHAPTTTTTTTKPWVVLINGLADPQTTWAAQVPAFTRAGYTVLTYDNRGVGLSSRPETDDEVYTAETMAADLRSLVKALNLHTAAPYHVMGVSMGGMIAQTYALLYGGVEGALSGPGVKSEGKSEIASLTLACTYAAPGPFCGRMFALWRDMARRMSIADVMRDVALWAFTPAFFTDPATRDDVAAMEAEMARIDSDMGLRAYLAQLNVITGFDTKASVGQLGETTSGMEVIVLAGEGDILIPVSLSKELHALIPGSRFRTTRGGHACMWEFSDEFNQACLEEWRDAEARIWPTNKS